jgi:hypothetical protein
MIGKKGSPPPRAVKVLCAILIFISLIDGTVRHFQARGDLPSYHKAASDWILLAGFAVHVCLAGGLAAGMNWLRWCFVIVATVWLLYELNPPFMIIVGSPAPLPLEIGIAEWIGYLVAAILCLVPSANDYFRKK